MTSKDKSTGKGALGMVLLTILALPGVGILPLLIYLQHRKRGKDTAATASPTSPNERGQYG